MPRVSDAFLAELGLERSGPRADQWGGDPGRKIWRAGLEHAVLMRMLEEAEKLAPFLKLSTELVFGLLQDLVIEESERRPFGLVAREQLADSVREPATPDSVSPQEVLAQAAQMAEARHDRPPRRRSHHGCDEGLDGS